MAMLRCVKSLINGNNTSIWKSSALMNLASSFIFRMRDSEKKKSNLFANFKKNDRDRKKLMDMVLKQLRALVNNGPIRG